MLATGSGMCSGKWGSRVRTDCFLGFFLRLLSGQDSGSYVRGSSTKLYQKTARVLLVSHISINQGLARLV